MGKSKKTSFKGPTLRRDRPRPEAPPRSSFWDKPAIYFVIAMSLLAFAIHAKGGDYHFRQQATTFDESLYTRVALQLRQGDVYSAQPIYEEALKKRRRLPSDLNRPLFKHPPLYTWLISQTYRFLDKKESYAFDELYQFSSTVANVMASLLILVVFLIGRRLYDARTGLLGSFFVAIDMNVWICAQRVWMESTLALLVWLTLWLFLEGLAPHRRKWLLAAGLAGGAAMLTKYPAICALGAILTYSVFYARGVFGSGYFYAALLIAVGVFAPWLIVVFQYYGAEAYQRAFMEVGLNANRIKRLLISTIVVMPIVAVVTFLRSKWVGVQETDQEECATCPYHKIKVGVALLLALGGAFLFCQPDFLKVFGQSLSWTGLPQAGWKMGMFDGDPWYFYLKQMLMYSPFYIFFFIAVLRMPFAKKSDMFLFIVVLWFLGFAISWKNFQGRYILAVTPAAMLLAARTLIWSGQQLRQRRHKAFRIAFVCLWIMGLYFTLKTLRVDMLGAFWKNVAYF